MQIYSYVLCDIILRAALHHSEGFGTTPRWANEALLQQPSLSWHQGKCTVASPLHAISRSLLLLVVFTMSISLPSCYSLSCFLSPSRPLSPSRGRPSGLLWLMGYVVDFSRVRKDCAEGCLFVCMCAYERIAKDDWLVDFSEIYAERHFKEQQYSLNDWT